MELKDWCSAERGRASRLAKAAAIPASFLSQILSGSRPVPPAFAVAIEVATEGQVTRPELRPDDWRAIWPELAERLKDAVPAEQAA
jgi:DNA-binding transcriptional regulator YdaS (Cro superfamily)